MKELEKIQKKLEKRLDKDRYQHTLGVMYTAASMAMRYDENIEEAMTAGLLHDCGKFCSVKEQMKLCDKYGLRLTDAELEVPALIHSRLGAYLAEKEYHIDNPRIINAILHHTTGRAGMDTLEKIIYLADYIEPGRKMIPILPEVRRLSFTDIDKAVCVCADATLTYLRNTGRAIDPMTAQTYEYYKK